MASDWQTWACHTLNTGPLIRQEVLQSLWGGHGELLRLHFGQAPRQVILKRIQPPTSLSLGETRKRRSYEVEMHWYQKRLCPPACRCPAFIDSRQISGEWLLLLEDLQAAGYFPLQKRTQACLEGALRWLARFHANTLQDDSPGLWEQGTYWHFQTRPEEWRRMPEGPLKTVAPLLDQRLRQAQQQCLVHGDAKPANFLWNQHSEAAAVDFQYVGRGCGIRDVAYLLSCFVQTRFECQEWLTVYLRYLQESIPSKAQAVAVSQEWLQLFPTAWCDLLRFEQGWGGPAQLTELDRQLLKEVLLELEE